MDWKTPKIAPFLEGIQAPPNTWFAWNTRVHTPNGVLIGLAVSAQLMVVFNRHTHTDRLLVCSISSKEPYLCIVSKTHTHTRLTALFRDYPGEPVPES